MTKVIPVKIYCTFFKFLIWHVAHLNPRSCGLIVGPMTRPTSPTIRIPKKKTVFSNNHRTRVLRFDKVYTCVLRARSGGGETRSNK